MASFDAIMKRLSRFDFDAISRKTASLLDELQEKIRDFKFTSVNKAMDAISDVLAFDSSTRQSIDNSLQQLSNALRSLRVFLDFLERNPNALVAGKAK
jgi:paraquat-inducible protein B